MSHLYFFENTQSYGEKSFNPKLQAAINLIKQNQSIVARRVLDAFYSDTVEIKSFYGLSRDHYNKMRANFKKEHHIDLPKNFPPTASAVEMIEAKLEGIIYSDKYIYMSSKKSANEIASTLVHEICHFLNSSIYDSEREMNDSEFAGYSDEVRSFTAEKMFERNGGHLLRSDVKKAHETVTRLYPEFVNPEKDNSKLGYIYGSYDAPPEPMSLG